MRAGQWQRKTIICRGIRGRDFDVRNSCIPLPHPPLHRGTAPMAMGMDGLYVGIGRRLPIARANRGWQLPGQLDAW